MNRRVSRIEARDTLVDFVEFSRARRGTREPARARNASSLIPGVVSYRGVAVQVPPTHATEGVAHAISGQPTPAQSLGLSAARLDLYCDSSERLIAPSSQPSKEQQVTDPTPMATQSLAWVQC